jgi:hypothetical protein
VRNNGLFSQINNHQGGGMKPSDWIAIRFREMVFGEDYEPDKALIEAIIEYLDMKYEEEHETTTTTNKDSQL